MSASQRDVRIYLEAGEEKQVPTNEFEFVYVKTAVRPVVVIAEGQSVEMGAGEKRRFVAPIDRLYIKNPDLTRPVAVVLVVGVGDYEKIVVTGQLTTNVGLLKADGTFSADRRFPISLGIQPQPGFLGADYLAGEEIADFAAEDLDDYPIENVLGTLRCTNTNYPGTDDIILKMNLTSPMLFARVNLKTGLVVERWEEPFTGQPPLKNGDPIPLGDGTYMWALGSALIKTANTRMDLPIEELPTFIETGFYTILHACVDHVGRKLWIEGRLTSSSLASVYRLRAYDLDSGSLISEVDYTARNDVSRILSFDPITGRVVSIAGNSGTHYSYAPDLSEKIILSDTRTDIILGSVYGGIVRNNQLYRYRLSGDWRINRSALEPMSIAGQAYATKLREGNLRAIRITRPLEYFETGATIVPVLLPDGRQRWDGEVIRAVLDIYYQGSVDPALYLDHVYGLRISDAGLTAGANEFEVQTEGQTFLAAEVIDNFSFVVPGVIELVIDDQVPLLG